MPVARLPASDFYSVTSGSTLHREPGVHPVLLYDLDTFGASISREIAAKIIGDEPIIITVVKNIIDEHD